MEKKVYACANCGKVTTEKRHLCAPRTAPSEVFTCAYCGQSSSEMWHLCFPTLEKVKYFCGLCGRVAPSRDDVCSPKVIPPTKAARAKPKPAKAKKR